MISSASQSDAKAADSIFPNLPAFFNFIYASNPRASNEKKDSNEEDEEDEEEGKRV